MHSELNSASSCSSSFVAVSIKKINKLMLARWIATPLAASAGIKPRVNLRVEDNPILEAYFTSQRKNPPQVNATLLTLLKVHFLPG